MSRFTEAGKRLEEKLGNTRKARAAKAMQMALDRIMRDPHLREQMLAQIDKRKFYEARGETADERENVR